MKYKLVFTVPLVDADRVRMAIGEAGAGKSGNYSFASFSVRGIGRFRPEEGATPAIGEVGKMEEVEEERVECQVDERYIEEVLAALRRTHPYEEIAYDVQVLEDM
ncbi:MAG TPA: NGG1p interacting factor NIF3 [Candidatus Paceibacterota bacterium]|nr:NGG1p interacting factor NIF3 [Candidatus Paceibacterota bacterium]